MDRDVDQTATAGTFLGGEPAAQTGDTAATDQFDTDLIDLTQSAGVDHFFDRLGIGVLTPDHAKLQGLAGGITGSHDLTGEIRVQSHGFFQHDVLAGLEGIDGNGSVHIIGRTDTDRFDLGISQKIVVVFVRLGNAVTLRFFRQAIRENIAECNNFHRVDLGIRVCVGGPDGPAANNADFQFFAHYCFSCVQSFRLKFGILSY